MHEDSPLLKFYDLERITERAAPQPTSPIADAHEALTTLFDTQLHPTQARLAARLGHWLIQFKELGMPEGNEFPEGKMRIEISRPYEEEEIDSRSIYQSRLAMISGYLRHNDDSNWQKKKLFGLVLTDKDQPNPPSIFDNIGIIIDEENVFQRDTAEPSTFNTADETVVAESVEEALHAVKIFTEIPALANVDPRLTDIPLLPLLEEHLPPFNQKGRQIGWIQSHRLTNVGDLSVCSEAELMALPNIGDVTIKALSEILRINGASFREDR